MRACAAACPTSAALQISSCAWRLPRLACHSLRPRSTITTQVMMLISTKARNTAINTPSPCSNTSPKFMLFVRLG